MASRRLIGKIKQRLAGEVGTVYKPHPGRLRFALAFPNTYYVGMSNLGFQVVYRLLNDEEDVVCERLFLPDELDLEDLARSSALLPTMESQKPARDFDVLGFSLSYELDYPNVLKLLALSGLKEIASERGSSGPLVIAGGPAATFNPEPLSPFVDLFVIGEAEEILPELVDVLRNFEGGDRTELLLRLAHVDGVYVPRFYEPRYLRDGTIRDVQASSDVPKPVRRRWVRSLDNYAAAGAILTPETEFSNMVLAEAARGCGRQCRFCAAGYAYLPPRRRTPRALLDSISEAEQTAVQVSGMLPRVGLLGASVFDHPDSLVVCRRLLERGRQFTISSTRPDTLSREISQTLHAGGHETLTIAPETGSERLRQVINKNIADEEILGAAGAAWDGGFRRLKLYFMVGLPTETEADAADIPALVSRIAGMFNWRKITVSLGCFVPKPWTPFQWVPMEEGASLARKAAGVRKSLQAVRQVEMTGESARESVAQGVLARGDRKLGESLLAMSKGRRSWQAAFRMGGADPGFYAQRPRTKGETLPWDHLDLGIRREYLWREYERAMKALPTAGCAAGTCTRCGVCAE